MALSENAQTLLEALEGSGRAANPATLHRKLGWSEEELDSAADEVCQAGLAEKQGSRLARVISGAGVSQEAEMLLAALPADGSTVGGLRLRSSLDLDNDTFTQAKQELRTAGLIVLGVGRGGTVARASARAEPTRREREKTSRLVTRESDLYDPFLAWLRAGLADQPGFAHARKMATPKGWKSSTGKWSRPDVVAVQVIAHEWLPDITVEVLSYEIKRFNDAEKLESVYEAAAHGRWGHRASLVVELDQQAGAVPELASRRAPSESGGSRPVARREDGGFDIREEIEPARTEDAELEEVNELIDTFLGRDAELRTEYRRYIGK